MRRGRRIRLILLLLVVALLGAAAIAVLFLRDDVRAWRQAIVVAGIARGEDDLAASAGRGLGGDAGPVEQRELQGLPATLVAPRGSARVPAVVLVVPAGTAARDEQRIVGLQRGLAAAGLAGWAVRVPEEDALLDQPGAVLGAVLDAIATDRRTRERHVSVIAAGPAASIVLAGAATDSPGRKLQAVVAIEPVVDLRALVREALIDPAVDPLLRARIGRLLARAATEELRASGATIAAAIVDRAAASPDPIAGLRQLPPQAASGRLARILAVLQARDAASFETAWAGLPDDLRARVASVSPIVGAASIDARVLVVDVAGSGADELGDGRALVAALPDARRIRVAASGEPPAVRELLSVSAWWLLRAGA